MDRDCRGRHGWLTVTILVSVVTTSRCDDPTSLAELIDGALQGQLISMAPDDGYSTSTSSMESKTAIRLAEMYGGVIQEDGDWRSGEGETPEITVRRVVRPMGMGTDWGRTGPVAATGKVTANDVIFALLLSDAILRDNLVTCFGFILHRPHMPLSTDLYSAMYAIFSYIRLRRLQTFPLLSVLKSISTEPPQIQYLAVFQTLDKYIPDYVKSTTEVWIEALQTNSVNMADIVQPDDGPLLVDLLASLDLQDLEILEQPLYLRPAPTLQISTLLGDHFGHVFALLHSRELRLSQMLFGLTLLHLPINRIVPQHQEAVRYLIDTLRVQYIAGWDEIVENLPPEIFADDPFQFVTCVLGILSNHKTIEVEVKQVARFILSRLERPTNTFANPWYPLLQHIVSKPSIDVFLLLNSIVPLEYPEEIVFLKNMLVDYIKNGYINIEFVTKGFIRYDYQMPIDVLIALLTRIQQRLPDLAEDVRHVVISLQLHLVFKKLALSFAPTIPDHFIRMQALWATFRNPNFPIQLTFDHERLMTLVEEEDLENLDEYLGHVPVSECSLPRQCLITVVQKARKDGRIQIKNPETVATISKILSHFEASGSLCRNMSSSCVSLEEEGNEDSHTRLDDADLVQHIDTFHRGRYHPKAYYTPLQYSHGSRSLETSLVKNNTPSAEPQSQQQMMAVNGQQLQQQQKQPFAGGESVRKQQQHGKQQEVVSGNKTTSTSQQQQHQQQQEILSKNDSVLTIHQLQEQQQQHMQEIAPDSTSIVNKQHQKQVSKQKFTTTNEQTAEDGQNKSMLRPTSGEGHLSSSEGISKDRSFVSVNVMGDDHTITIEPINIDLAMAPARLDLLDYLVPKGRPGTPEYYIFGPLKQYLATPNIIEVLQIDVRHAQTNLDLVRTVLSHMLQQETVASFPQLWVGGCIFLSVLEGRCTPEEAKMCVPPPQTTDRDSNFLVEDPVAAELPADMDNPSLLLPYTEPLSPADILLKPVRYFLALPNLVQILGPEFRMEVYQKRGQLLRAILKRALEVKPVQNDKRLYEAIKLYVSNLEMERKNQISINFEHLLRALPVAADAKSKKKLSQVKEFILQPNLTTTVCPGFNSSRYRTIGTLLKNLLSHCLQSVAVESNDDLKDAIQLAVDGVYLNGIGAQPIEYIVTSPRKAKFSIDINMTLKSINTAGMNHEDKQKLTKLLEWFQQSFRAGIHLKGFKGWQYETNGLFMQSLFEFLTESSLVDQEIKDCLMYLYDFIDTVHGIGATPLARYS